MSQAASITVRVPLKIGRKAGQKTVVMPVPREATEDVQATRSDPALLKALARAFRYQKLLDEGLYGSITEMACAERIERGYLGSLLRLTLLAPHIVEALLNSNQPTALGLPRVMEPFSISWNDQLALWHPRPGSDLPAA
jgi:hypothetical protein